MWQKYVCAREIPQCFCRLQEQICGAEVERIGLQADAALGDAAAFPVVLILSASYLDIRSGMPGRAEIRRKEQNN